MEKLYKSRSEACLWQVKEKFWNKSLPKQKKIVPGALKGRCLSVPYPSPLSLRLMNNNFSSLISSQEGDLCRLRECTCLEDRVGIKGGLCCLKINCIAMRGRRMCWSSQRS